ncbi:amidase [Nocardia sp. NBC_01329]|uniref:amidase n=1 Tax=Nocardia sp. NBC_01329 TaxID=2903594 RepID=UPI002E12E91E|nr:amidase [Nocardia sp. NBC_01329]
MTPDEQRVRALLDLVGLITDAGELASLAADYPLLRDQVDQMHRTVTDGVPRDTSIPKTYPAGASEVPCPPGTATTIEAAAASLRDGTISASELLTAVFARIDLRNEVLGAYVRTFRETAFEAAERADRELAAGLDRGPLHGIPLNVKDVIATVEGPTLANSLVPPPHWQGDRDATVVARLRKAGAIVIGKTTTNEFALGPNDPAKGFPMPRNAWSTDRYAGGSSSGLAVAVASGMALGGVGTDTSGSLRHPAALNGVTGLKVSSGRVSKSGVVPLSGSLDTVGPLARSARDCALLLQAMAGYDPSDPESSRQPVPQYLDAMDGTVRDLRIGWPKDYFFSEGNVSDPVRLGVIAAISGLREAGATVREVSLPSADLAKLASTLVLLSEGLAYHRDSLVARWADYGIYLRGLLARGALFTAADYVQAKKIATVFRREVFEAMRDCDVLILPTMPTGARLLDETDPTMMDRWSSASFMSQWSLIGLPSCAVPVGLDRAGMPVSMQIIGRAFDESTVLRVADAYQRTTSFHLAVPAEQDG